MLAETWTRMAQVAGVAGAFLILAAALAPRLRFPGLWASASAALLGIGVVGVVAATATARQAGGGVDAGPLFVAAGLAGALGVPVIVAMRRDRTAGGCLFWLPRVVGALALAMALVATVGLSWALHRVATYTGGGDKDAVMTPFKIFTAVGVLGGAGGAFGGAVAIACGAGAALWRRFGPRPDVED